MKRVIILAILLFCACAKTDNDYYDSKEEIMLRSLYQNDFLLSYLGSKDGFDEIIIASKKTLKTLKIDGEAVEFVSISHDEFALPYANKFYNFYKAKKSASKALDLSIKINENPQITIRRISKSLDYHL